MIGFYDSGIGGLTILNEFKKIRPDMATAYFADTKNMPLGQKTPPKIKKAVQEGILKLFDKGCDLVVLACNTATCITIKDIQTSWLPEINRSKKYKNEKQVLGIARPVSEELVNKGYSKDDKIIILGTKATVNSGFYKRELEDFGYTNVEELCGQNLALLIEQEQKKQKTTKEKTVKKELQKIFNSKTPTNSRLKGAKAIVLACTHYPYIEKEIKNAYTANFTTNFTTNEEIEIISQSLLIAKKLSAYIDKHDRLFYITNSTSKT